MWGEGTLLLKEFPVHAYACVSECVKAKTFSVFLNYQINKHSVHIEFTDHSVKFVIHLRCLFSSTLFISTYDRLGASTLTRSQRNNFSQPAFGIFTGKLFRPISPREGTEKSRSVGMLKD